MFFVSIDYDEDTKNPFEGYKGVQIGGSSVPEKYHKVFFTNNFITDWFFAVKHMLDSCKELNLEHLAQIHSSSVDHFIMDGAPVSSAYLHIIDNKPILRYSEAEHKDYHTGVEFFVPKDTQPTWEELKKLVGYFSV